MIGLTIYSLIQIGAIMFIYKKGYRDGVKQGLQRVYEELDD